MSQPKDANGLTAHQEHFAQLVASGLNQSDAYRQSYNVSPDSDPANTWEDASVLAKHPKVFPRIQQLKASIQAATLAEIAWNQARLLREADRHRELALTGGWRGVASANGALELIGRVTGIIRDKAEPQLEAPITRIVIVLDRGADAEGRQRVVEGESRLVEGAAVAPGVENPVEAPQIEA